MVCRVHLAQERQTRHCVGVGRLLEGRLPAEREGDRGIGLSPYRHHQAPAHARVEYGRSLIRPVLPDEVLAGGGTPTAFSLLVKQEGTPRSHPGSRSTTSCDTSGSRPRIPSALGQVVVMVGSISLGAVIGQYLPRWSLPFKVLFAQVNNGNETTSSDTWRARAVGGRLLRLSDRCSP
jgi:hypothetical protein